jgi:2-polyprenyl-3-methyl-5-hydroxy-6-metoxy-1,4-benzoquinol methylase
VGGVTKRLLHVGCGGGILPEWAVNFKEVRLDIDPEVNPDIVASMTDLGVIGTYDAVYANHCLEHLASSDVRKALSEFYRVLNDEGFVFIMVPDLEDVKPTNDVILEAPVGPITGLDMMYGLQSLLNKHPYMAHRTGFIKKSMEIYMENTGFRRFRVERLENYNLLAIGVK